jgi:hypothetical protein
MKFIPYIDQHDITHHVDVSQVMYTETAMLGPHDEEGNPSITGTRICLATQVGGYVFSKEPPEVIWPRILEALK